MDEPPPPWIAVPWLKADDPANQGLSEAYVSLNWLPFWRTLEPDDKTRYLDRWNASSEWRDAIAFRYDHQGFDVEADARDAAAWAAARRDVAPRARSLWDRLTGRGPR